MKNNPDGYTGEWIVKVHGLKGPEEAAQAYDLVTEAIDELKHLLGDRVEVSFDASRWQGGDF